VANLGANVFVVDRFGIITSEDAWVKAQKRPLLTLEEFTRLRENMRTANAIAAIEGRSMDVRSGNVLLEDTNIRGVTPNYPEVRSMNLASGRLITEADETHRSPVCYIGADVAKKFFYNVDPIGKTIRAGAHSYQVIGVAAAIAAPSGNPRIITSSFPWDLLQGMAHAEGFADTLCAGEECGNDGGVRR